MHETTTANGTPPIPVTPLNGHTAVHGFAPVFAPERLKELVAALAGVRHGYVRLGDFAVSQADNWFPCNGGILKSRCSADLLS